MEVNRKSLRIALVASLLISGVFACWTWLRPYEWSPDVGARATVVGCLVKQDRSNYWIDLHLKLNDDAGNDFNPNVCLVTVDGREVESVDVTKQGRKGQPMSDVWFKFWLEQEDLAGSLDLQINEGSLKIRVGEGMPNLGGSGERYFVTNRW